MVTQVGTLIVASVLGAAGLALVASGASQPAPSLTRALGHLDRRPSRYSASDASQSNRASRRLAQAVAVAFRAHPRALPTDAQLRLVGRTPEQHAGYLAAAVLIGFALPAALLAGLQVAELVGLEWYAPVAAGLVCASVGPLILHTTTIEAAQRQRANMRHELSAYLDVVSMLLAGNSGYEGALEQAAWAGDGRLFLELRRAMREAGARGSSLTDALQRSGVDLGIDELEQVAATASLSAAEGAPVAKTLAAKCATLRAALATEQETDARLRTSRLTTPVVGMALIFMALVIYPALSFS